jgi:hypothetical protein
MVCVRAYVCVCVCVCSTYTKSTRPPSSSGWVSKEHVYFCETQVIYHVLVPWVIGGQ